jgi:hypothetical protein
VVLVYERNAVEQALNGPHYRIEEGPLAIEQARHKEAKRLGHQQNGKQEESNLKPAVESHIRIFPVEAGRKTDTPW